MSDLTQIEDHPQEAVDRLPEQHKSKANIEAMIRSFCSQCGELEQAIVDMLVARQLDTATGVHLDRLGAIVGQPRDGVTDDELYRRYIRARIFTNKSSGTAEELIRISKLIVDDDGITVRLEQQQVATILVWLDGDVETDVTDVLIKFLRSAKAAGVKLTLLSSSEPAGTTFKWDTPGRGWDNAAFLDAQS